MKSAKKIIIGFLIITTIFSTVANLIVNASAGGESYLVVGVGRNQAIKKDNGIMRIENLETATDKASVFRTPLMINDSTYVPFRYILESAGFIVDWDSKTDSKIIKKDRSFPFWYKKSGKETKEIQVNYIECKNNAFKCHAANGQIIDVAIGNCYEYFDRTYIPVRTLEMFGFIIKWDNIYNLVHIYGEPGTNFKTKFMEIYSENDNTLKNLKANEFFETKTGSVMKRTIERYVSNGTDYNNCLNNGLVLKQDEKIYMANMMDENKKVSGYTIMPVKSRQLCYTALDKKEYIYYINMNDKKIYKRSITQGEPMKNEKVVLPADIQNKTISQLSIVSGSLFFLASDNVKNGGYVYMAKVGNEINTTVRLTANKAWNLFVSQDNKVYFSNNEANARLESIDLKDVKVSLALYKDSKKGLWGKVENWDGVQSIAFSNKNPGEYYYCSTKDGAIYFARSNESGVYDRKKIISLKKSEGLHNFLNLYETDKESKLYYIYYLEGRKGNLKKANICSYDVYTGENKIISQPSEGIQQLSITDNKIFYVNADYTSMYMFDLGVKNARSKKVQ